MPPRGKGTYGKKVGRPPKPPKGPKKPKGAKSVLKGRLKWSGSKLPTPKGPKGPKRKKISLSPFSGPRFLALSKSDISATLKGGRKGAKSILKGALKSPTMESRVKREKIYRGMNLIFKQMGLKTRGKLKTRRK